MADSVITAQRLLETAEKKALVEFAHSSVRSRSVCRKFSGRQLRIHASTFGPELAEVCETVEDTSVILNDTRFDRDSMQMFQNVDNVALFIRQCQFLGVSAPSGFLIAQDAFNLKLELKQTLFDRLRLVGRERAGLVGTMVGYFVVQNVAFV